MGCGASQSTTLINGEQSGKHVGPKQVWLQVCQTLDVPKGKKNPYSNLVVKRTGWKTIRIFVSSTFKDFHREREILVKEVFPDLRAWCENRRLHLVECDLRWGIPKDSTTELTLRTCLGEIDRCYQDNIMPFFVNMTSERIGWIPSYGDVPRNLVDEYKWIFGLSITEMEIVHGAYRKDNPNSLFLIRDDSFLATVPDEYKTVFIDENPVAPEKLKVLKQMIEDRFPKTRITKYKCEFDKFDPETNRVHLNVDDLFKQSVFQFFKDRISAQYPLLEDSQTDVFQHMREGHESFMKAKSESVLGRGNILDQIRDYVDGKGPDVPLILLGGPGSGKSSIMAKAVDNTLTAAIDQKIAGGDGKQWNVFYHFVGALPGSTSLQTTLQRLLKEIDLVTNKTMPSDMETIVQMTCSALNVTTTAPTVIIIDAINQFDKENHAEQMTWVPRKLGPNIRCIFSMIDDTPPHKALMARESKPSIIKAKPLSIMIRKEIVTEYLGRFNKKLDEDQMISLLSKDSSENPLWLSVACEELRVFGEFRRINDKINTLADGLLELLQQVLGRFEEEGGGHLLVATLCLLEVSATGLLEAELLQLLADEENLMPNSIEEKGSKEESEKETKQEMNILPAYKWAAVYRSLRPFLRPFGDSGEGRLDFYHRSLSKAVRAKYLKIRDAESSTSIYNWWHSKLAKFFSKVENINRKIEEYPYNLLQLKDTTRLEEFLGDFKVFDKLYDRDYSPKLILYWKEIGGQRMMEVYSEQLQMIEDKNELSKRCEQVTRALTQMGQHDAAKELGKEALDIEENELGARPDRMGDLYSMMAAILAEKLKTFQYIDPSQTRMEWEALSYTRKALKVYEQLASADEKYKTLMTKQMIKMSFSMMSWSDVADQPDEAGDYDLSAEDATSQGRELIDKAIEIIENELRDKSSLPEAYMTKATFFRFSHTGEELKWYKKAEEKALELFGQYHMICGRIQLNTGIAHEDAYQHGKAFHHFKDSFEIFYQILGPDHPMTQRLWSTLHQGVYQMIARSENYDLLPLPPGLCPE